MKEGKKLVLGDVVPPGVDTNGGFGDDGVAGLER
jgi:hypothetical protein